jgi:uncharacterized protein (TIGR02466 family)
MYGEEMIHIDSVFPTAVMVSTENKFDISEDTLTAVEYERADNGLASWSVDKQILEREEFFGVKQIVNTHVSLWFREVFGFSEEVKPRIITSWIFRMENGDSGIPHAHANCILSGVCYLKVNGSTGNIAFIRKEDTFILPYGIEVAHTKENQYNNKSMHYKPEEGMMVLFPAHLKHAVSHNTGESVRYSLAFNVWMQGKIGKYDHELVL